MKERPILFSTPMVQAILASKKTMTRRVVTPQTDPERLNVVQFTGPHPHVWPFTRTDGKADKCPYGQPGDLLWVRETWRPWLNDEGPEGNTSLIRYMADDETMIVPAEHEEWFDARSTLGWHNRPSIHMPKWACRIWLKVTEVRVERLKDISEKDAVAEGVCVGDAGAQLYPIRALRTLWDSINAGRGYGWDKNPWVWVVGFERVGQPQAANR